MIQVRISFDYELLWGVWDKVEPRYFQTNVSSANTAIRGILAAHRRLAIPCTFAIVGALLARNQTPRDIIKASQRPNTEKAEFDRILAKQVVTREHIQAPDDILDILRDDPLFEIGSHTHTHIYALEASESTLAADFEQFNDVFARRFDKEPRALVMPKNQVTPAALRTAKASGYHSIRVNPDAWLYRPIVRGRVMSHVIRLLRMADSFLPLIELNPSSMFVEQNREGLTLHVGQYFLRPWFPYRGLFTLHLLRLKLALFLAKRRVHQVHFWLHPHNLGRNPVEALSNYNRFLDWLKHHENAGSIRFEHMSVADASVPDSFSSGDC